MDRARTGGPGKYIEMGAKEVASAISAWDTTRPLVIDPVLAYSTDLGGSQGDEAHGVAADRSGRTYVTGQTSSLDLPTTPSAFQPVRGGYQFSPDALVVKITR